MAVWRRRALELFPQLRRELTGRDYSVYSLFFDLKPMLRDAYDAGDHEWLRYDAGDHEWLRRIFGFAEWCSPQTAKELWNAAGVAFYEHLFDYPPYSERVIPWWSARIVFTQWQLWEAMGAPPEWARLQPRLAEKRSAGEREVEAARRTGGN